ncbi:hypothetical protein BO443_180119 [Burkholderia orbicola]
MRDNPAGRVLRHVYPAPSMFAALIATPGPPGLTRRPENPCPPTLPADRCRSGFPLRHTLYLVQNYSTGTKYSGHSEDVQTDNLR